MATLQSDSIASQKAREFAFSDEDFNALRVLVKEHTGIHLTDQKRELVYGRISRRLRALDLDTFREYRELLTDEKGQEIVEFCNAITTNLTSFFRVVPSWTPSARPSARRRGGETGPIATRAAHRA